MHLLVPWPSSVAMRMRTNNNETSVYVSFGDDRPPPPRCLNHALKSRFSSHLLGCRPVQCPLSSPTGLSRPRQRAAGSGVLQPRGDALLCTPQRLWRPRCAPPLLRPPPPSITPARGRWHPGSAPTQPAASSSPIQHARQRVRKTNCSNRPQPLFRPGQCSCFRCSHVPLTLLHRLVISPTTALT